MDVADTDAIMAAMETEAAAEAMAYDGVLPEALVILVEARPIPALARAFGVAAASLDHRHQGRAPRASAAASSSESWDSTEISGPAISPALPAPVEPVDR